MSDYFLLSIVLFILKLFDMFPVILCNTVLLAGNGGMLTLVAF